jgi:hypothetical protein
LLIRHDKTQKWSIWWSDGIKLTQEILSNEMNIQLDNPIHGKGGILVFDFDRDGNSDIISGHPNWIGNSASNYKLEVMISRGK